MRRRERPGAAASTAFSPPPPTSSFPATSSSRSTPATRPACPTACISPPRQAHFPCPPCAPACPSSEDGHAGAQGGQGKCACRGGEMQAVGHAGRVAGVEREDEVAGKEDVGGGGENAVDAAAPGRSRRLIRNTLTVRAGSHFPCLSDECTDCHVSM